MVPHAAKTGRSFKGVGQYLFRDKKAKTSKRVAHFEAVNIPTKRQDVAVAHMINTAEHAHELGVASGSGARGSKKPVYHYSLSWHPSEKPTTDEQIKAARDSLKALGMEEHQAFLVIHTDEEHPHIHVVVNLVHPETGRTHTRPKDHEKLSDWAREYQRERGQEWCPQREINHEKRKRTFVKDQTPTRQQHYEWKRAQSDELWAAYRKEKEIAHGAYKPRFQTLWDQRNARIAIDKAQLNADYKTKWRDIYQDQRSALQAYDNRLTERLKYAARQSHSGRIRAFLSAVVSDDVMRAQFIRDQGKIRQGLSDQQLSDIRATSRRATDHWVNERDALRDGIKDQNKGRLEDYKERSDDIWETPAGSASEAQKRAREAATRKLKSDAKRRRRKRTRGPSP